MPTDPNGGKALSGVSKQFGIVISLLLPGFTALWPFQHVSPVIEVWFSGTGMADTTTPMTQPSGGSVFLIVVASLAIGLLVGAIRWATVDQLHEQGKTRWAVNRPELDYSHLHERLEAFEAIMENHYKYYQFYANMIVAVFVWTVVQVLSGQIDGLQLTWVLPLALLLEGLLFFASRDALQKTSKKSKGLLGDPLAGGGGG